MPRGFYKGHEIQEHNRSGNRWFTVDKREEPHFATCEEAAEWIDEHLEPNLDLPD